MDLRATLVAAVDRLIASGEIEKRIEELLAKAVGDALANQLRSYSDFAKQLDESVKKSLAFHGDLELPTYGDAILKIIRRQVEGQANDAIQKQVADQVAALLERPPASITLAALVEQYVEHVKERFRGGCVCDSEGEITCIVRESEHSSGFTDVFLSEDANKRPRDCDIQIGVYRDRIYHLSFRNADVERQLFVGPLRGFERMLFQMKAAGSQLVELDESAVETHYELGV